MSRLIRFVVAAVLALGVQAAFAAYPDRPITLIVPWGAGGGTDAVARFFGAYLEKELGQPVNVVNRTGGNGVVGHSAIAQAAPDGYTFGLITVEISMMHWQGLTELTPASYQPLSLVNADPAGFQVRADSSYKSVKEVIDAIKANPGKMKASGTGQGGIWHLAIAGLLADLKIDPNAVQWVPSNGAAPGLQDLVAGDQDGVVGAIECGMLIGMPVGRMHLPRAAAHLEAIAAAQPLERGRLLAEEPRHQPAILCERCDMLRIGAVRLEVPQALRRRWLAHLCMADASPEPCCQRRREGSARAPDEPAGTADMVAASPQLL